MRKIDRYFENPIDNIIIDLCVPLVGTLLKYKITPNHITTLSLLAFFGSMYCFTNLYIYMSVILWLFSYYLDCLDGFYARSTNMVTVFGDYYDHLSDLFKFISINYHLLTYKYLVYIRYFPLLVLLAFFTMMQIGAQELLYNRNESATLGFTRYACFSVKPDKLLVYTRYFGSGTIVVFYGFLLWL